MAGCSAEGLRLLVGARAAEEGNRLAGPLRAQGHAVAVCVDAPAFIERLAGVDLVLLAEDFLEPLVPHAAALAARLDGRVPPCLLLATTHGRPWPAWQAAWPGLPFAPLVLEAPVAEASLCSAVATLGGARRQARASAARLADLEAECARFETLVAHLPVAVCFIDQQGRTLLGNARYAEYVPNGVIPSVEPGGASRWLGLDENGQVVPPARFVGARALRGEVVHGSEFRYRPGTSAERWTRISGVPLRDAGGQVMGAALVILDIDAQKRNEEMLRRFAQDLEAEVSARTRDLAEALERLRRESEERARAEEQLRQSLKMDAVGQLTGGIAHDFNNLLTGIIGALDLMRLRLAKGREDGLECLLDTALGSSHRAAALTQRLLAFSRRQSLERRPTPINPLVRSLAELLQRSLSEQVSLVLDLAEDAGLALADANQLESALLNLCLNARDAMPDGGTLHLETRPVLLDVEEARRLGGREGRFVRIRVRDSGIGIPAPLLGKVFEPFFTTKPLGQGTGLGLSMVYGFVQQSEGFIGVDSQPGAGTCFTLHMPATLEGAAAPRVRPRPLPVGAGAGQRILLVEDDEAVRALLQNTLEDLGYQVHLAEDGTRALALLERLGPLDLLLSDVGLPGLDGRQLADVARRLWPGLPVILMTGYAEQARVREAFLGPGMRMLNKPFALERLAEAVAEACAEAAFAEAAYAEAASDRAPDPDAT